MIDKLKIHYPSTKSDAPNNQINVYNDKKEKYQSFSAELYIMVETSYSTLELNMIGYGYNEEEAISELKDQFKRINAQFEGTIASIPRK